MAELTAERLKELVSYDPETGEFTWLPRPITHWCIHAWNRQWAGKRLYVSVQRSPNCKFYALVRFGGRHYGVHRLAWLYTHGRWPADEIDHKDNNPLNNRIDNLREATHAQNQRNKGVMRNNRLGIKGVTFEATRRGPKKYKAQYTHERKHISIGWFTTAEEASAAYIAAVKNLHGEFLHRSLNTQEN